MSKAEAIEVTWTTYTERSTPVLADVLADLAADDSRSVRHRGVLTCDHAASSYGLPVLVLPDGSALGSGDIDAELGYSGLDCGPDGEETAAARKLYDAALSAGYRLRAVHA